MTTAIDQFGSFVQSGPRFSVLHARGPLWKPTYHRQQLANIRQAICYVEGHFNAVPYKVRNHAFAILNVQASERSKVLGRAMVTAVCKAMGTDDKGALTVADFGIVMGGSGSGNIPRVRCPALLLEPGFISEAAYVKQLREGGGLQAIGKAIAEAIRDQFPSGGCVALSVGHAYRGTGDKGAFANQLEVDPDPAHDQESELVELYLNHAADLLVGYA